MSEGLILFVTSKRADLFVLEQTFRNVGNKQWSLLISEENRDTDHS